MISRSIAWLAVPVTLALTCSVQAAPTFFAGTGHYYEHIATTTTWAAARTAALGMTHLGESGYLVTITSVEENTFLSTLSGSGWIGGTDQTTEGMWVWADGPEAGVNFWNGNAAGSSPTFASVRASSSSASDSASASHSTRSAASPRCPNRAAHLPTADALLRTVLARSSAQRTDGALPAKAAGGNTAQTANRPAQTMRTRSRRITVR